MKTVCILVKAPREGSVKTRLARDIGHKNATEIYRAMVEHQAKEIPTGWDVAVYFAPADASMEMKAWLTPHLPACSRFVPQCDGDLGMRLSNAVQTECTHGAEKVFLIGGDCPGISCTYLSEADRFLDMAEVVIGPAKDGGYVLLALKVPHPALFKNIAWSTSSVLRQTLASIQHESLTVRLLPALEDVDDVGSLERQRTIMRLHPTDTKL